MYLPCHIWTANKGDTWDQINSTYMHLPCAESCLWNQDVVLCFVMIISIIPMDASDAIYPYFLGLFQWQWGSSMNAPVTNTVKYEIRAYILNILFFWHVMVVSKSLQLKLNDFTPSCNYMWMSIKLVYIEKIILVIAYHLENVALIVINDYHICHRGNLPLLVCSTWLALVEIYRIWIIIEVWSSDMILYCE